jgi:hypothetical protein
MRFYGEQQMQTAEELEEIAAVNLLKKLSHLLAQSFENS